MSIEMITNLIILIASLIGFIYGCITILVRKKPLYLKMIVFAIACMLISRIYIILQYITTKQIPSDFNVGMLGLLGCFLFLFSSNYGVIDSLGDDGSPKFLKYRLISFIIPIVLIASYCSIFLFREVDKITIIYAFIVLFISISARYHFKHIIFPDVEFGIIRAIRGYNTFALLLCISTTICIISYLTGHSFIYFITGILISICCLIIIPILKKEASKWTTT